MNVNKSFRCITNTTGFSVKRDFYRNRAIFVYDLFYQEFLREFCAKRQYVPAKLLLHLQLFPQQFHPLKSIQVAQENAQNNRLNVASFDGFMTRQFGSKVATTTTVDGKLTWEIPAPFKLPGSYLWPLRWAPSGFKRHSDEIIP